ncbi:unnamed protein product [Cladocopium goreaui]|uniref:Ubiquitin-like domain-containing protein n=1 Tax=Cladocopium goreaui TaxID=2562237 RepID=A0A9P1DR59_9DINO|nr:unnamed protein product [Cladocopium goreaui]
MGCIDSKQPRVEELSFQRSEQMSDEKLLEIVKDFAGGLNHPMPGATKTQGDFVIVKIALERESEDDFFEWALYHVPSWKPGAKPLLKSHFCDLSHVGCKGTGQELTFGAEGEVLKVDGNDSDLVRETLKLKDLMQ